MSFDVLGNGVARNGHAVWLSILWYGETRSYQQCTIWIKHSGIKTNWFLANDDHVAPFSV